MEQQILGLSPGFLEMFVEMLNQFEGLFLKTSTWSTVRKKIERSKKTWGEN